MKMLKVLNLDFYAGFNNGIGPEGAIEISKSLIDLVWINSLTLKFYAE